MSDTPSTSREQLTPELLASQAEWLRRLARRLVLDDEAAQELAQDTLAIALERPPRTGERLRGWLATVLRNRAAERARSAASRRAREERESRPEATPGADELVERVQLQRQIADHLLALPEATRTALVLRYYEDLPPREIAARTGVPVATVKSRLARGLASLRSTLDDDHGGDRAAWAGILAPWVLPAEPPVAAPPRGATTGGTATAAGGLLMNTKLLLGLAAVAAGAFLWTRGGAPSAPGESLAESEVHPSARAPLPGDSGPSRPRSSAGDPRSAVPSGSTTALEPTPTTTLRGLVLDASGAPLGGLEVRLEGEEQTATSSAGGAFELTTSLAEGRLQPADPRWIPIRSASWRATGSIEPVLVVAPALTVGGTVVDAWGRRLEDVRLVLEPPTDFAARFEERLDASIAEEFATRTDAEGTFRLERLPALPGATLRAVRGGYAPAVQPAPLSSFEGLWIELRAPLPEDAAVLRGRVVRADGAPASDALVRLGNALANADAEGAFVLSRAQAGDATRLVALEAGSLPGSLERGPGDWPDLVELRLGGAPLEIAGRVVDAEGRPRAGGRVWLADPTRFARVGAVPVQSEALLSGARVPDAALDSLAAIAAGGADRNYGSATPAFEPDAVVSWVRTDAEGRFRLGGLQDRTYVLNVAGEDLSWGLQTDPVPAGTDDLVVELPAGANYPRLRGRLLSAQGDPVPDVAITPWVPAFQAVEEFPGGSSDVLRFFLGKTLRTDAEGRFELTDVPRANLQFHAVSDDIVPSYFSVEDVTDPEDFRVTVEARAHFEVIAGPGRFDALAVVGQDDAPLELLRMRADGYSNFEQLPILDGRSGVVTVSTGAAAVLLFRAGEQIERVPLRLRPGSITTIAR